MSDNIDPELLAATDKTAPFTLDGINVTAKCTKVHDGDTCHIVCRLHPGDRLHRFTVRMLGYNSAEIHGETEEERVRAQESVKALRDMILDKIVTVKFSHFDKWGNRVDATLFVDNVNVNQYMIDHGYGVKYEGKGEKLWK